MNDLEIGASWLGEGRCRFRVWAPKAGRVEVRVGSPGPDRLEALSARDGGYHEAVVEGVAPGSRYSFRLDGGPDRPDPASRYQPEGVHGPSCIVDPASYSWSDGAWRGLPPDRLVIYELHVGTFTAEGTFDAIVPHLDRLWDLGITAIELMPVAQFPGSRNWGYDGVQPYAVQNSYGGPDGLRRLVDACHARGMAVVLDVVYNHIGPEGNYLGEFGHYFSDRFRTPWGDAINFDGPHSDDVRRFFIGNAICWVEEFHVDALRLDAIHGILDTSARPFLQELAEAVHERSAQLGREVLVTSESDLNDVRVVLPAGRGGHGHDAQWNDDFHHALHVLLTGERNGYYGDFDGAPDLQRAFREGFVFDGRYSRFRNRRHGSSSAAIPPRRMIVFAQNHDQVGNRMLGERLGALVTLEALKLAAAAVIVSPYVPLIFMGEEYGETAPFLYFVSHSDPGLIEAVRRGRREEFAAFRWDGEAPDPQDEQTFLRSRLDHSLRDKAPHRFLHAWYAELLRLRRGTPALARLSREETGVQLLEEGRLLIVRRGSADDAVAALFNLGGRDVSAEAPGGAGRWRVLAASADARWGGPGGGPSQGATVPRGRAVDLKAWSFVLLARN